MTQPPLPPALGRHIEPSRRQVNMICRLVPRLGLYRRAARAARQPKISHQIDDGVEIAVSSP